MDVEAVLSGTESMTSQTDVIPDGVAPLPSALVAWRSVRMHDTLSVQERGPELHWSDE